jgi:hypothetical protein
MTRDLHPSQIGADGGSARDALATSNFTRASPINESIF